MHTLAPPTGQYVDLNGLKLHYLDWGNATAETLVLLHGLGSNSHAWDHIADDWRHKYHVIALDQRGHGDTSWAADGYRTEKFVDDLKGVVDYLGLKRFRLVGHSMGGINAIVYTAKRPESVERLVIVDIGPEIARPGIERMNAQTPPDEFDTIDDVFHFFRAQDPTPQDDLLMHRARHAVKRLESGRWAWKADPALRSPSGLRGVPKPDHMWKMLAGFKCPTLIVRGEKSDLLSRETAERMARTIPQGKLVEIAGAGHRVPLDRPEAFEKAVSEFLEPSPSVPLPEGEGSRRPRRP